MWRSQSLNLDLDLSLKLVFHTLFPFHKHLWRDNFNPVAGGHIICKIRLVKFKGCVFLSDFLQNQLGPVTDIYGITPGFGVYLNVKPVPGRYRQKCMQALSLHTSTVLVPGGESKTAAALSNSCPPAYFRSCFKGHLRFMNHLRLMCYQSVRNWLKITGSALWMLLCSALIKWNTREGICTSMLSVK